ncbi:MAG: ABC transporter permease, partial [Maritimibacter sp.]
MSDFVNNPADPIQTEEGEDRRISTVSHESQSYPALVWRRFRRSVPGMFGLVLVIMLLIISVFAEFFAPVAP